MNQLPDGEWYVVSNYGYGDGACYGPFTADEALVEFCKKARRTLPTPDKQEEVFRSAQDKSLIHYISDNDRSDDFTAERFQDS